MNKKLILSVILVAAIVSAVVASSFRLGSSSGPQIIGGAAGATTTPTAGGLNANPRIATLSTTGSTTATVDVFGANCGNHCGFDTGSFSTGAPYIVGSLTNSDANDRIITEIDTAYTSLGTTLSTSTASTFLLLMATSTTATTTGNTDYIFQEGIATSTPFNVFASSTPGLITTTNSVYRVWPAGTNIAVMASATTSSPIIVRVSYIPE